MIGNLVIITELASDPNTTKAWSCQMRLGAHPRISTYKIHKCSFNIRLGRKDNLDLEALSHMQNNRKEGKKGGRKGNTPPYPTPLALGAALPWQSLYCSLTQGQIYLLSDPTFCPWNLKNKINKNNKKGNSYSIHTNDSGHSILTLNTFRRKPDKIFIHLSILPIFLIWFWINL